MTQKIRIESLDGPYTVAVQCGANEPYTLQPGQSTEIYVWSGNELRVYEIGPANMDQPNLV